MLQLGPFHSEFMWGMIATICNVTETDLYECFYANLCPSILEMFR